MTIREGNLDAPTRHPLDWRNADFHDEASLNAELARVFDICHGCRRCVNLCNAFPTLFDLVDATEAGEVEGVDRAAFGGVVDQCYLCDVCYMTKCPYVPPHPWNVDFPHLMLRAKARKFVRGETRWRDRLLTSTDALGRLATIPVVVRFVNRSNATPLARKALSGLLGVHPERRLPPYAAQRFEVLAPPSTAWPVRDGGRTAGKVAIFSTCYVNYNEPGIGLDLLRILDHNEIAYRIVDQASCCGMPKLELGDLESVQRLKDANAPRLAALAREGYALLTPVPSCTLMFKSELPLIFPEDADVQAISAAMFDPFEYLVLRDKDGLLKKDFNTPLGKIAYHIPCHSRVQNIGQKTRAVIEWVPGTTVHTV
jgi:glycerol-3-phosphate dehydrogenase subunit C